jgi:hypothetical protein
MDFEILDGSALDGFLDTLDKAGDRERRFSADILSEFDHLLAELLASSYDGLYGIQALS